MGLSVGSESESGESQQAVERLKGLGGSLRDLIPFGNRGEKGSKRTQASSASAGGDTQPVAGEGPAPSATQARGTPTGVAPKAVPTARRRVET